MFSNPLNFDLAQNGSRPLAQRLTPAMSENPLRGSQNPVIVQNRQAELPTANLFSVQQASTQIATSQQFSLELTTKEGDRVTIYAEQSSSYSQELAVAESAETVQFSLSQQAINLSRFQFQVEGNLNPGEEAAIKNVLDDMQLLASEFFAGNSETALDLSESLRLDQTQLSRLEFSVEQSLSAQWSQRYVSSQPVTVEADALFEQLSKKIDYLLDPSTLKGIFAELAAAQVRFEEALLADSRERNDLSTEA